MAGQFDFVKALYPYSGSDQSAPLSFSESAIILVVERTEDGWCRGFCSGNEGWFPASYVKPLTIHELSQNMTEPLSLVAVMHSSEWTAYATDEEKVYYVNSSTQGTTWEQPLLSVSTSPVSTTFPPIIEGTVSSTDFTDRKVKPSKSKAERQKKPKFHTINGVTFLENGPKQALLVPTEVSYVDHFWADKGDQTGFDIILEKHLNGKEVMKDMIEFFRERASIEEQYAKRLLKLSKTTLGDLEEGTLAGAWQSIKAELRDRSAAHSKLSSQLLKDMDKPLMEFKESQKKERKEHQQIIEKSRKQLQTLDSTMEKTRLLFSGKGRKSSREVEFTQPNLARRRSSATGDDLKRMEESYNQAQRLWVDNMINACRDFERAEAERSDYLKNHLLSYVDLCVAVDESSAESLSRVTDAIDRIRKQADREYFIRRKGTGTQRPADMSYLEF